MKSKRFLISFTCLLAGVAIAAFLVGSSLADHQGEYRGMDDRFQDDLPLGILENHISANWAITPTVGSAVTWFIDDHLTPTPNPTITPIAHLVRTSIAKWATANPAKFGEDTTCPLADGTGRRPKQAHTRHI